MDCIFLSPFVKRKELFEAPDLGRKSKLFFILSKAVSMNKIELRFASIYFRYN